MDKKFYLFVLLLFLFSFIVISCDYFVFKSYKEWLKSSDKLNNVDVYTCGWVTDVGPPVATRGCYWINDSDPIFLDECSLATAIFINNNDVYIAGYDNSIRACYWKNGRKNLLPASGIGTSTDLVVKGGIVFNSGFNNNRTELCYWVNDKKYNLNTAGLTVFNNSIFNVSINVDNIGSSKYDISLAGSFNTIAANTYTALLWKNGGSDVYILTPIPSASVRANRLVKYKNDLYIAGNDGSSPGYWINTTFSPLPYFSNTDYLFGICVKNDKIYAVGTGQTTTSAIYWEDNNVSTLPIGAGGKHSQALNILIYNDNIYIAGQSDNQACYWVNSNSRVDLPGPTESIAIDILVVPSRD